MWLRSRYVSSVLITRGRREVIEWAQLHVHLDLVRSRRTRKRDLELCREWRCAARRGGWDTGRDEAGGAARGACVYPTDWGPNVRKSVVMRRRRCEQSYGDGRYGRRAFDTPRSYCCLNFEITADNRLSYITIALLVFDTGLARRCQPWAVSDCFLIWHTTRSLLLSGK